MIKYTVIERVYAAVRSLLPVLRGLKDAQEQSGRQVIEQTEVGCFGILFGYYTGTIPQRETIAMVSRVHDWMERFNRLGDENSRTMETEMAYWMRPHLSEELAQLETEIDQLVTNRINEETTMPGDILEQYVKTTIETEILMKGKNTKNGDGKTAEDYRLTNDRIWLKALMTIIARGDSVLVDKCIEPLLAGVMLFQISDDFAYARRNREVGKIAFFTEVQEANIKELMKTGECYLGRLEMPKLFRMIIGTGWFLRTMIKTLGNQKSGLRFDNDNLFDWINIFEENIETRIYGKQSISV